MAIREIALYPERCLKQNTTHVTEFDDQLGMLVNDMVETMYDAPGIGLAAPQIRVLKKIFVVDVSENNDDLRVFINPEIIEVSGSQSYEEGCLSLPGIYEKVTRPEWIKVKAQHVDGSHFELETDGLLAICIQHEYDHLNGTMFIDHLSRLKHSRTLKKYEKKRLNADEE